MKLIKDLGTKRTSSGGIRRHGLFYCSYCSKTIEKDCYHGKRDKSCGCYKGKLTGIGNVTHGDSVVGKRIRLYRIWLNMKNRCSNPKLLCSKYYYDKGIKVCDEWENSYIKFKEWALNNGYKNNLQIDRIDSNGNYSPENCQWLTAAQNTRKSSQTKMNWLTVRLIRAMHKKGYSRKELLDIFDTSIRNLGSILTYSTWKEEVIYNGK